LITLVEYGDFECPYCGDAYRVVNQVLKTFGADIRYVFRNYPLQSSHPHAEMAAEAAEAAGAQDKYWKMFRVLYEHQNSLDLGYLLQYGRTIGLEMKQFEGNLNQCTYSKKIMEDFRGGVRSGVTGTPTFFINDVRYEGSWDYESLSSAIQKYLDEEVIRRAI
jgi:protein-disulfide isomerase